MVTAHREQLADNDATILNSARGQLTALAEKIEVLIDDQDAALTAEVPRDYTDAEAGLYEKGRGPLNSAVEKLREIAREARDALVEMDTQLEHFDAEHPERTKMTTTQKRAAEKELRERNR